MDFFGISFNLLSSVSAVRDFMGIFLIRKPLIYWNDLHNSISIQTHTLCGLFISLDEILILSIHFNYIIYESTQRFLWYQSVVRPQVYVSVSSLSLWDLDFVGKHLSVPSLPRNTFSLKSVQNLETRDKHR